MPEGQPEIVAIHCQEWSAGMPQSGWSMLFYSYLTMTGSKVMAVVIRQGMVFMLMYWFSIGAN